MPAAVIAATTLTAAAAATPGSSAAPLLLAVDLQMVIAADGAARHAGCARTVFAAPDGFAATVDGVPACSTAVLQAGGSAACPPGSQLGSGSASFFVLLSGFQLAGETQELALFHGAGRARVPSERA